MRRHSIAGPIILIALGSLFLINNIHPDFSLWHKLARYWPFLLILFGVLRLAEVLFDAGRGPAIPAGQPLRPRRSGGGLGLVIVLCGIFWLAEHGPRRYIRVDGLPKGALEVFGDQYNYPISAKGKADGIKLVVLEGLRGNVTVTGGDEEEYSAEGQKTVRGYAKSEADEADRATGVKFVREGNQLILRMEERAPSNNRSVSTELDLNVPRGVNVEVRGRSGDVTVNSIDGTVDVSTDRGDVRLSEIGGDAKLAIAHSALIQVEDSKGKVDLDGRSGADVRMENVRGEVTVNGSYSGRMEFKNLTKPLHFQSPNTDMRVERLPGTLKLDLGELRVDNVAGPMRMRTKSRDIHVDNFVDSLDLQVEERGDIQISTTKTPLGKIDAHTRNGNIDLGLPEKVDFDLRAATKQGEAHNDYGAGVRLEVEGRAASLKSVSESGPAVTATTDRGAISIGKSSPDRD